MSTSIRTMASGKLAIDFGEEIDGGIFTMFADRLIDRHGWRVTARCEDPGGCIYHVIIESLRYELAWDEWTGATLASTDAASSARIPELREGLDL